jgi:hypothetical protein
MRSRIIPILGSACGLCQAETVPLPLRLVELLDIAATAPSSHNSQPWRVRVESDTSFRLEADPARRLREVDPDDRETMLSLGAFWETFEEAATASGWTVESSLVPVSRDRAPLAVRISLTGRNLSRSSDPPVSGIRTRSTPRGRFETTALRPDHLRALQETVPSGAYFEAASPIGRWISRSLVEANVQQAANTARQRELGSWMRFSRQEARDSADGLTPEMMGKGGLVQFWWYHFLGPEDVLKPWFREASGTGARDQVEHCAGFFVITSRDRTAPSLLQAGREYQRLNLLAPQRGIAVHPMSQLMEESPWKEELPAALGLRDPVQFILRTGYAPAVERTSKRRPAGSFTTWDQPGAIREIVPDPPAK